jgi:hypothetical protein
LAICFLPCLLLRDTIFPDAGDREVPFVRPESVGDLTPPRLRASGGRLRDDSVHGDTLLVKFRGYPTGMDDLRCSRPDDAALSGLPAFLKKWSGPGHDVLASNLGPVVEA